MKQKLLFLLTALMLLVTGNAWGDPQVVNVLSEDYESYAVGDITSTMQTNGWTFQSRNGKNEVTIKQGTSPNSTKYFDFYYPDGGASRNQRWDFGVASSLNADNWTLTFSAALNPGVNNSANKFYITGTVSGQVASANNDITNPIFALIGTAAGSTTYKPTIGATSYNEEYTLASGTWYKFTIRATEIDAVNNTATLYVKVTSYDGETKILEKTVEDLNTTAIGALRGICWNSPRGNSRLNLDDVLLTKESSAEMANYTVKYVSTIADVETEIKSQAVREGEVGETVTLETSDKNVITYEGHQFYYVSDDASTSTINNDNSTVVKVVFAQATFDNGNYYFKNKANGAYFAAGNNWGTHAISNLQGHITAFTVLTSGKYSIDTHISNGGNNHYLNGEYTDGAAQEWAIASDGAGYYTINNGSGNLTAGAVGENLTVGASTGDNAKWTVLTAAEWKADQEARLAGATAANGEDATFYIAAPNFPRNDNAENAKWQGSPKIAGYEGDNGNGINYNGEKFTNPYATFDVYQALTGVKPGAYKLTAQGFYRNGLNNASNANDNLAKLYANSTEVPLKNIRYYGYTDNAHSAEGFTTEKSGIFVPDNQSDAGLAFNANKFENELYVVVGEDGILRIGVKKTAATGANEDWTVFDNFKLTYYGNTVSATIGSTGWTTFASPYALNLNGMSASTGTAKAYYASSVGDNKIVMTSTNSEGVAAGTGLMLKGTAGATVTIPVAASGDAISGNMLVGCTTLTEGVSGADKYVLVNNGEGTAEFQNLGTHSANIPAGKAYLNTADPNQDARLAIVFEDDDPTAINAVEAVEAEAGALKDGKYLIGNKIVLVKNGVKYSANGQKLN